jgi:hypothetical protein
LKRYAEDSALIERRAKFWRARGLAGNQSVEPGRFRKRHPLDCGRARCGLCHSEKLYGRRSPADKRADERAAYELRNDELS